MVERAPLGRAGGGLQVDRDLVQRAMNGDQEAFTDLIRVRVDRLYAIAQRILRDANRAEDAVQDALVMAWRDLKGLRDPDRIDAWLCRLVVNVCLAEATRERHRVTILRVLPADGPAAPDETLGVSDRDQLERGFRRLPADQRAILVLHHYAGHSPAEIAETLGIPAGTARSRLHHAHRAMRAALEADARSTVGMGRPA